MLERKYVLNGISLVSVDMISVEITFNKIGFGLLDEH